MLRRKSGNWFKSYNCSKSIETDVFFSLEAQKNTHYMKSQIQKVFSFTSVSKECTKKTLKKRKKSLILLGLRHSSSQITWMEEIKSGWLLKSSQETRIAEMNVAQSTVKL